MAAIDELDPADVLGKKVVNVYDLSEEGSVIMQCLENRQPIIDRPLLYRTRRGKVANTIHTVFPLFKRDRLEGAICLVREYNVLEETISSISIPRPQRVLPYDTRFDFDAIVGSNIDFLRAFNMAKMAANTPSPVMLYGKTGTGKELFAQAIHNHSGRNISRYTAVNCAAIPENLLEGLLFGTTSGAFTGARNKLGLFECASGSLWGGAAIAFPLIFAMELVRSSLTSLPGLNLLLYGLLLIVVTIYYPGGFAQFFDTYIRKPKNRMMDYFLNGAYGSAG